MKCKNCGHLIGIFWKGVSNSKDSYLNKTIYEHKKGPAKKSIKYCYCGCTKPEPENQGGEKKK